MLCPSWVLGHLLRTSGPFLIAMTFTAISRKLALSRNWAGLLASISPSVVTTQRDAETEVLSEP